MARYLPYSTILNFFSMEFVTMQSIINNIGSYGTELKGYAQATSLFSRLSKFGFRRDLGRTGLLLTGHFLLWRRLRMWHRSLGFRCRLRRLCWGSG